MNEQDITQSEHKGTSNKDVLLRNCQAARIGGQLTDDLTAALLCSIRPTRRSRRRRRTSPSYGSHPLQRHEAADVVGEVLQSDLHSRSHDADRPHEPAAG